MIEYRFNGEKDFPLIEDVKLLRKLNRECNKVYKKYKKTIIGSPWTTYDGMDDIPYVRNWSGARYELYDYWFSDASLLRWPIENISGSGNMALDMSITPIGSLIYKNEVYFFCFRHDERSESLRLWFKLNDGLSIEQAEQQREIREEQMSKMVREWFNIL